MSNLNSMSGSTDGHALPWQQLSLICHIAAVGRGTVMTGKPALVGTGSAILTCAGFGRLVCPIHTSIGTAVLPLGRGGSFF